MQQQTLFTPPLPPVPNSLWQRLARSTFRQQFHLTAADKAYVENKGLDIISEHAQTFISKRLAAVEPKNDGKQTPMRGHPVFIAQHATACCCRGCIEKWHHIPKHTPLTDTQQRYLRAVILQWIQKQTTNK